MTRSRTTIVATITTVCLAAVLLGSPGGAVGAAGDQSRTQESRRSTAVEFSTPRGQLNSYVVNARRPWTDNTRRVRRAVRRSGGVVVQAWPQIGVVVAHSRRARFRSAVRHRGRVVASVGATRTTRVIEGTPGRARPTAARPSRPALVKAQYRSAGEGQVEPDPREKAQWDMRVIKADRAQEITAGSDEVLVGILDTGIDHDHPDLEANLDIGASVNCADAGRPDTSPRGWRPTISDHGTHVAGTVGAARNGVGIVGVAPKARLASVKVVNDSGLIYPEYAVCGFMWAGLQGMDVTNSSYYIDPFMFWCSDRRDQSAAKRAVARAVAWSTGQGVVHAAAAGNAATDLSRNHRDASSPNDSRPVSRRINARCHELPAELPGVVAVSSFAQIDDTLRTRLSYFSNIGLGVIDVAAPGSDILSTVVRGNGYARFSGTSMASPHAAGVLALLAGAHPGWEPARLAQALAVQADDTPCRPPQGGLVGRCRGTKADNGYAGEGMVDALDAVQP